MIGIALAAMLASAAELPPADIRTMIRDTRRVVGREGAAIWPGFQHADLAIDVIDAQTEYLFCTSSLPGFGQSQRDPVTGCGVQTRARTLPVDLSASFELLPGRQVVAIGTPAALAMDSPTWKLTMLHESFHQYQAGLTGYADAVNAVRRALGVTGADWALSYAFPYADAGVMKAFATMTGAAHAFLIARDPATARTAVGNYVAARQAVAAIVGPKAWKYYEFQVGHEGVARWTEIVLGESAARSDPALAALAHDRRLGLATSLRAIDTQGLGVWKRSVFYVLGAIEAEMLERERPGWRADYIRTPIGLGQQLAMLK